MNAHLSERARRRPSALGALTSPGSAIVAGLAAVVVQLAVVAPFMSRYGWDRDELYFLVAAHHPALGYVDFPPVTAWIGWVVQQVDARSLVALRVTSLAAGATTIMLTVFIARELGGGRLAQWLAAFAWALTPYILGSASIFHPTWFDALAWVAFLFVATRLLIDEERQRWRDERRLWLMLGVIAGVGLEAKYTIVFLIVAFALALVVTNQRGVLLTRGPWLALAIALALLLPNLIWEATHGWPSVHFFSSQNAATASATSRSAYVAEQLLFLGASSVLPVVGVVWLWRRGLRALALIPVIVTLIFFFERGRGYYPLPADSLGIAAGAVSIEGWLRGGRRLLLAAALVALQAFAIVFVAPVVVPFYSTERMISTPAVWKNGFFKDEIGWPEMTVQVERAWGGLSGAERADAVVLTDNYGEAGALQFFARGIGPVLSGHLSWQYWRPRELPQRFALTVGYSQDALGQICRSWRPVARIDNRWHLGNEERGKLIGACSLKQPLGALWKPLIATNQL